MQPLRHGYTNDTRGDGSVVVKRYEDPREWAHPGGPVEDLAWCEWIVRMHHREHLDAIDAFFGGYGHRPAWPARHDAMVSQCPRLLDLCRHWTDDGVRLWRQRLAITAAWTG